MAGEVAWRQYLDAYWGIQLTAEAPSWREYRIDNPSGPITCRSMLMRYEFAMLFALARDHYLGDGAIVDGWPIDRYHVERIRTRDIGKSEGNRPKKAHICLRSF